jgi:hypothetical protein
VKNGPDAAIELYDLEKDPGEKDNLADSRPELVKKAGDYMASERTPHPDWPLDKARPKNVKPGGM